MGIDPDTLPVTTDPDRIDKFLEGPDQDQDQDDNQNQGNAPANLREIPYILQASRELAQYEKYLQGIALGIGLNRDQLTLLAILALTNVRRRTGAHIFA
jgi:hypothetical protein